MKITVLLTSKSSLKIKWVQVFGTKEALRRYYLLFFHHMVCQGPSKVMGQSTLNSFTMQNSEGLFLHFCIKQWAQHAGQAWGRGLNSQPEHRQVLTLPSCGASLVLHSSPVKNQDTESTYIVELWQKLKGLLHVKHSVYCMAHKWSTINTNCLCLFTILLSLYQYERNKNEFLA